MVSGLGKPSIRFKVPIEVSSLSGVATPGAIGVVILKGWADAVALRFATRAAAAMGARSWRKDFIVKAPQLQVSESPLGGLLALWLASAIGASCLRVHG